MIDVQLADKLSEVENKSALINSLLEKHFMTIPEEISTEELQKLQTSLNEQSDKVSNMLFEREELVEARKEKERLQEIKNEESWEEHKARAKKNVELKNKYLKEIPYEEQSKEHFENWLLQQS